MRRWIPVLALAFVVGALFRLGNELGIAVLRMFGTQGIVVIGILVAWNIKRLQVEDGLRRLELALKSLPGDVRVRPLGKEGAPSLWLLEGRGRRILLGTSDVANSVRARRAQRLLVRDAARVVEQARAAGAAADDEHEVALVLLRRSANGGGPPVEVSGRQVVLVNPEKLGKLFEGGP